MGGGLISCNGNSRAEGGGGNQTQVVFMATVSSDEKFPCSCGHGKRWGVELSRT